MTTNHTPYALRAHGVGIQYPGFKHRDGWALENISFDLAPGEVLGVVGRNGAGKTSLLKSLAGITRPDRGEVLRKTGLRVSLLTINMSFIPHLPCRENICLTAMLLGMSRREINARYEEVMDFAELDIDPRQKVGTFSEGMRARLALGISMVAAPEILLIDELLGVGDGLFLVKSYGAIRDLIKTERSVVLVSHNLPSLRDFCDRVMWIEDGNVCALGDANEVLDNYQLALEADWKTL